MIWIGFGFIIIWLIAGTIANFRKKAAADKADVKIAEGVDGPIEDDTPKYESAKAYRDFLYDEVKNGADGNYYVKVYTKVSQEEIEEIGHGIDPFYGRITSYTFSTSTQQDGDGPVIRDKYMSVNFDFVRSEEAYVYDSIVNGKEIPADKTNAIRLKEFCEKFLEENITSEMSDYDKELFIHDYIVENCVYATNPEVGQARTAYGCLVERSATCEGYTKATALLLRLSGVAVRLVDGYVKELLATTSDAGPNHMWNQVKINGAWYNLDVTWDDPTGESGGLIHLYMNVSDEMFSYTHRFDEGSIREECTSMDENYYVKNNTIFYDQASFEAYVRDRLESGDFDGINCVISNLDISQDALYFVFEYDGVNKYKYFVSGDDAYKSFELIVNPK